MNVNFNELKWTNTNEQNAGCLSGFDNYNINICSAANFAFFLN